MNDNYFIALWETQWTSVIDIILLDIGEHFVVHLSGNLHSFDSLEIRNNQAKVVNKYDVSYVSRINVC